MKIFVDLDEVVTDFIGSACAVFGITREQLNAEWEPGVWDMIHPLNRAVSKERGGNSAEITEERFWSALNKESFWANLPMLPGSTELLEGVAALAKQHGAEWYFLTSPSLCPTSYSGKVRFLQQKFGRTFNQFFITPHKHLFAKSDAILIDDREETVKKFTANGGKGILFPARHNSLHALSSDRYRVVDVALGALEYCLFHPAKN